MKGRVIAVGDRVGRLVVVKQRVPGEARVECRCDCGRDHSMVYRSWGRYQSCGCFRGEQVGDRSRTHGQSGTPEYLAWHGMHARCEKPEHGQWKYYGGRGIAVCERWSDFRAFLADVGRRPSSLHSIDRVDNSGDYAPENCRWATKAQQMANRRTPERRTHCLSGLHELTPENTMWLKSGSVRTCLVCRNARRRELRREVGRR